MSAIADFRIISVSKLKELSDKSEVKVEKGFFSNKVIDGYWTYLDSNSKKLSDFNYSGYIFADLLIFLEEDKGIDFLQGAYDDIANTISEKRENSTIICTYQHRQAYLDKLSPDRFTLEELIAFNKSFSENDDPELARMEMEGIKALRDNLELLTSEDQVILLTIG